MAIRSTLVDAYISEFPLATQDRLIQIRNIILDSAPDIEELISYKMPAYKRKGMIVWYAAYSKHIGLYPTASGIETFKAEFTEYKWAKGSVQFPLDKPLPLELIKKIIEFKLDENQDKTRQKRFVKQM